MVVGIEAPHTDHRSLPSDNTQEMAASLARGWRLWSSGNMDQAAALCRQLMLINPEHGQLLHLSGMVLWKQEKLTEALTMMQRAISIEPGQPLHYNNLGVMLNEAAKYDQAVRVLEQAIQLSPNYHEAHNNLGLALYHLNALPQSAERFEQALTLCPDHAPSLSNLGMVCLAQGNFTRAIETYEKAVAIDGSQASWWGNLGAAYLASGKFSSSTRCFQQANRIYPENINYHNNLGVSLRAEGDLSGSIQILRQGHALAPDHDEILSNLCIALQLTCQWNEAAPLFERLDSHTRNALSSDRLPAEQPMFNIRRSSDRKLNLAVARAWSRESKRKALRNAGLAEHITRGLSRQRLTIGYLSYDFRDHPVAHQLLPLFGLHDRSRFRVLAFSMGPDDKSDYRRRIQDDSDEFIDIAGFDIRRSAAEIHKRRVDILIDLMGHSHHSRLEIPALRPAPIQISYLGFLSTCGADFVDYTIADPIVVPTHHAAQFSESVIRMPHCYQMNHNEFQRLGSTSTRDRWGLPDKGIVFCSFNKSYKIDPSLFGYWASILRQVPDSVLWLYNDNPIAVDNLRTAARNHQVHPDRLIFSSKIALPDHLKRLELADLALDTVTYNGGATTANALWAGLPVLGLLGCHWVSRMTASHLIAAGLPELVTHDLAEYEKTALRLATSSEALADLRGKLRNNRSTYPLFDARMFVRHLERAYRTVWDRYSSGRAPISLSIPPMCD